MPQIYLTLHPHQAFKRGSAFHSQQMLTIHLGDYREVDHPQNPLVGGKQGTTVQSLPTLATFLDNLEQKLLDETLLPGVCSTRVAADPQALTQVQMITGQECVKVNGHPAPSAPILAALGSHHPSHEQEVPKPSCT